MEQLAVDADVVAGGVSAGAELGDDLSVDDDAALKDDGLGGAAGCDAGVGEDFLQAVAGGGVGRGLGGGLHVFIIACQGERGGRERTRRKNMQKRTQGTRCSPQCAQCPM